MGQQRFSMRPAWERATTGTRLWWAVAVATGIAALLVLGSAVLAPAGGLTTSAGPVATAMGAHAVSGQTASGSASAPRSASGSMAMTYIDGMQLDPAALPTGSTVPASSCLLYTSRCV